MKALSARNHLLDAMKTIAAIGVIFVHFAMPGPAGKICASLGIIGVIFFFLISGYQTYCASASDSGKILHRFKRNLIIAAIVISSYLLYTVIKQIVLGTLAEWAVKYLLNPITYVRLIVLGDLDFIGAGHLWYLVAMLYGYLILYCMEKYRLHKVFYIAMPFLVLLRISMETYTNSFSHFSWFDWHFSGNILFGALPIMLLGSFICRYEARLLKAGAKLFIPCSALMLMLVFLTVNVKVFGLDISQTFKIAAGVFLFLLCLAMPLKRSVPMLGYIGRHLSLHIYLWHQFIGSMLSDIFHGLGAKTWVFDWCLPFAAILVSILVAIPLERLNNKARAKTLK